VTYTKTYAIYDALTRYFYDTEFIERGPQHPIDLVSIGIVTDTGREFYAVSAEFDQRALLSNPWLVENVWPSLPTTPEKQSRDGLPAHGQLDLTHPDVRSRPQIARAVQSFILGDDLDQLPHVELWADYGAYDHVALCQLFGSMIDLPDGMPMFTHDVQQEAARLGYADKDLPRQKAGLHNALADARHTRVRFEFLAGTTV
jgi:hypothetical protein